MGCYGTTALVLSIATFLACAVAHAVPHWLVSWGQKQNTFSRIGLWEVCFTAFSDPKLYAFKYYSGCWWIHHHELDLVRPMLNPAWFKAVQAFASVAIIASGISMISMLVAWCKRHSGNPRTGYTVSALMTFVTTVCTLLCIILFGACAKDPRMYRLPMPQYNYFGASFAFIIIACLLSGFGFAFHLGEISQAKEKERERYQQ